MCINTHMCIFVILQTRIHSIFQKCNRVSCTLAGNAIANYNQNILDSELYG